MWEPLENMYDLCDGCGHTRGLHFVVQVFPVQAYVPRPCECGCPEFRSTFDEIEGVVV